MAGIEPLPSLSDSQVIAMAGGPVLRIEAIASSTRGARLDPGDAVYKGPHRLGRALLDSSLALPILIQVAQKRQSAVFQAPESHLKSLASLYDAVSTLYHPISQPNVSSDPWRPPAILGASRFAIGHHTHRIRYEDCPFTSGPRGQVWYLCTNMYADHSTRATSIPTGEPYLSSPTCFVLTFLRLQLSKSMLRNE